jgi:hypothetical protein
MAGAMGSPYTATWDSEGVNALLQRLGPLVCCHTHAAVAVLNTATLLVLVLHTTVLGCPAALQGGPYAACAGLCSAALAEAAGASVCQAMHTHVVPCVVSR